MQIFASNHNSSHPTVPTYTTVHRYVLEPIGSRRERGEEGLPLEALEPLKSHEAHEEIVEDFIKIHEATNPSSLLFRVHVLPLGTRIPQYLVHLHTLTGLTWLERSQTCPNMGPPSCDIGGVLRSCGVTASFQVPLSGSIWSPMICT